MRSFLESAISSSSGGDGASPTRQSGLMNRIAAVTGTGQVANKDDDRIVHPMVLVEEATRRALDAAGVKPETVDAVYTTPLSTLVTSDSAALLAERLGGRPGPRSMSSYSGAAPQALLSAAVRAVAAGEAEVAVVAGGIADASVRRARVAGIEPPAPQTATWSQGSGRGPAERQPWGDDYIPEIASGAGLPFAYFALVQSVLDAGLTRPEQESRLGRLLAPFTEVASRRPELAWFPLGRSAEEIAQPSAGNRLVAEPYTKLMCSFPTVDLAAALVVTADPGPGPAVYVNAVTTSEEAGAPSSWTAMDHPIALEWAVEQVFGLTGTSPDDIGQFDLYSCFPAAVLLAEAALGLPQGGDGRDLTSTGGLPYFGGPGASYQLHGLVCLFEEMRARDRHLGMAVGVGGMVTNFSAGVYSLEPVPFHWGAAEPAKAPAVKTGPVTDRRAVVEAMTVLHDRGGPVAAPIVARTADGTRFGARCLDPDLPLALSGRSLVGEEVEVRSDGERTFYRPL